jgi:hypothetical protein
MVPMNKTTEELIKKVIEKAVERGWEKDAAIEAEINPEQKFYFDHNFAKAFFGEEESYFFDKDCPTCGYDGVSSNIDLISWQYHLQELVLQEEPLQYLQSFL